MLGGEHLRSSSMMQPLRKRSWLGFGRADSIGPRREARCAYMKLVWFGHTVFGSRSSAVSLLHW
jgi:hypothetical protein